MHETESSQPESFRLFRSLQAAEELTQCQLDAAKLGPEDSRVRLRIT